MDFICIVEANLQDAEKHLLEAVRTRNYDDIQEAKATLRERLELIRKTRPELFAKYSNHIG